MSYENVQMYCGTGAGRSAAAIGQGIRAACEGKSVFIVSFLKGKASMEFEYLRRLEPEIKLFCFDKYDQTYHDLTDEEKQEERIHIQNAVNFARKVAANSECDVLILDELLGAVELGIVSIEDTVSLIEAAKEDIQIILTGVQRCERLWPYVSLVTEVSTLKHSE